MLTDNINYYKNTFPVGELFDFAGKPFTAQRTVTYPNFEIAWGRPVKVGAARDLRSLVAPHPHNLYVVSSVCGNGRDFGCFVMDVDLDKYDRRCRCADATCCDECWVLAMVVVRHVTRIATQTLGIHKPPLFVYSGGRGLHVYLRGADVVKYDAHTLEDLFFVMNQPVHEEDVAWAREILLPAWGARIPVERDQQNAWWTKLVQPIYDKALMNPAQNIRLPFSVHPSGHIALPLTPAVIEGATIPRIVARDAPNSRMYQSALAYFKSQV